MYTILHISDLHRSRTTPVSNEELLSSVTADCSRFQNENPKIAIPNAVVISGDIISGLPLNSPDYPSDLENQYLLSFEFLKRLCDTFVEGDRSKVIIVPGNHDVDWNKAYGAMEETEIRGENVRELLSLPNTPYRWSWNNRRLYAIRNYDVYEERFEYFCKFYHRFYDGAKVAFKLDPRQIWNRFELDNGHILVCAFNSCVSSDCFNPSGEIPASAIAQSHLADSGDPKIKIAVWHHDIEGNPKRSDYLDPDTLQVLIDRGYRIGLHGHRHKADSLPVFLRATPEKHSMVVIGAGSLCADPSQLPHGLNRQYNVIEISDDYSRCRIHVREMNVPGIFSAGRIVSLGGASFADSEWTPVPSDRLTYIGRGSSPDITVMEHIENLILSEKYDDAITEMNAKPSRLGRYGRELLSEALFKGKKWSEVKKHLSEPQNADELTKLMFAIIKLKDWDDGDKVLAVAENQAGFSSTLIKELRNRLNIERGMSK